MTAYDRSLRFPVWPLSGLLLVTAGFCLWLGWSNLYSHRLSAAIQQRHLRLQELRGVILQLDEVLTMSAQMAAATAARHWEDRYRRFEPQLDEAIKEALRMASSEAISQYTAEIDAANLKLVEMEHRVFELVHQGQLEAARAVLSSQAYEIQKRIYSTSLSAVMAALAKELMARQESEWWKARVTGMGALAGLALMGWGWAVVISRLRRWRSALVKAIEERTQAEQALRQNNDLLELRVQERTAALSAAATERELLIKRLEESLANVKTLSGLVPICASCKKVRDDKGFWNQVENYVTEHSEAKFSHGLCPECVPKYFPDYQGPL